MHCSLSLGAYLWSTSEKSKIPCASRYAHAFSHMSSLRPLLFTSLARLCPSRSWRRGRYGRYARRRERGGSSEVSIRGFGGQRSYLPFVHAATTGVPLTIVPRRKVRSSPVTVRLRNRSSNTTGSKNRGLYRTPPVPVGSINISCRPPAGMGQRPFRGYGASRHGGASEQSPILLVRRATTEFLSDSI